MISGHRSIMPAAFTEKQQIEIRQKLCAVARELLEETPYQKIRVEQLTKAVGISKGAFYKFYPAKEMLFYEILRSLHKEMYDPVYTLLEDPSIQTFDVYISKAITQCAERLESSRYKRFWLEDSLSIMEVVMPEESALHDKEMHEMTLSILRHFGELAVDEETALHAVWTLIASVYGKPQQSSTYESILCWMAQGVCRHIYK